MSALQMTGLRETDIEKIASVFSSIPEIDEAIIYGSRAKGNFRPNSDIDITLKGKGLNRNVLGQVNFAIDDLLLPYFFDISIYHELKNPALLDHIDRVGIIMYKSKKSAVQNS